jgi:hypothetical protein
MPGSSPTDAALFHPSGVYNLFDLISQIAEMLAQFIVKLAFGGVCSKVPDQGGLSLIRAEFSD